MTCKRQEQCDNGKICQYANSNEYDILCGSCYRPKKPQTNFDRITASAESLAEFISNSIYDCVDGADEESYSCSICPMHWCSKQDVLEWLKQESKEWVGKTIDRHTSN